MQKRGEPVDWDLLAQVNGRTSKKHKVQKREEVWRAGF